MTATNFKTENNKFRNLSANGLTYHIPRFQRDYSWTNDEWEDLWADILATLKMDGDKAHYMGYLVLQSTDDRMFAVIDGQQRLTTINLIILAALKNLKRLVDAGKESEQNSKRLDQIRQTYIGYLDPVTLVARPKLILNRNNNDFFQNHLVPLLNLPQRGLRASDHLLRKAFEWFDREISRHIESESGNEGPRLAKLIENISDSLFFTVITVSDELNAYKVFETLNSRGVRLSATDLLKNYLFSILDRGAESTNDSTYELRNLEERWEQLVGRLQSEKFPDFLRVHWNSRHSFSRQSDLFKTIRAKITDREAVFRLLREMDEDIETYLALSSPEASNWLLDDKQFAGALRTFRVRQPFALLLAAKRRFSPDDFTGFLRAIMVISLRYNVICTYATSDQERVYNAAAERIAKGESPNLSAALQDINSLYVSDRNFRTAFSEKTIRTTDSRNNRVVRFILCALEKHLTGQNYSFSSDAFEIEHILPQNAPDGRGNFSHEEAANLIYRLGNMTLLNSSTNRELGTQAYTTRRAYYQKSNFEITRKLAEEHHEWGPEEIAAW